jgi:LmbE family N-acetylglucosaminyl deacetylase
MGTISRSPSFAPSSTRPINGTDELAASRVNSSRIGQMPKGRLLVLVAHQDDETACAGLLQRVSDRMIVYATNGAPPDPFFWGRYGSQAIYSSVRRNEAIIAAAKIGVLSVEFLDLGDQRLYCALDEAFAAICNVVRRYQPDVVLVPAYEGGHPDHDCCSFLGALLRGTLGLPVWEMPLYHRSPTGKLMCQEFRVLNGTESVSMLSSIERRIRDSMIAAYESQADLHDFVFSQAEVFRPQAAYDYSLPAHEGLLNYEVWQWPITGPQVCQAFMAFTHAASGVERDQQSTPVHESQSNDELKRAAIARA